MASITGSIDQPQFVVMRFKRIKTWAHVYHVRRHNTREMECLHLEEGAPAPLLIVGTADVAGAIRKVLARYGVTPKPGEVLALEFVVSSSREVFDGLEGRDRDLAMGNFLVAALQAFEDRFKVEGQIVSVALHQDERTPHLHVVVVPLVFEPDNRCKDRTPGYRLSAKRVVGGRGDMSREQTRFASFFEDLGLERGKERSGARHISNREHEAQLEVALQEALAERDGLASDRRVIAHAAIKLGNDRDALADEKAKFDLARAELAVSQERARQEEERLASDRAALSIKEKEADALKNRAIKRTRTLRDLLVAGEGLQACIEALPEERRTPELLEASEASKRLVTNVVAATSDDSWLATMLAYRGFVGPGMVQ